jgi:hypothetical protein
MKKGFVTKRLILKGFYQKQGFRRMKTGMALFKKSESMREREFTE